MSELNTNQDLILDLMNYSKFGPLSEVFIMNAVQAQAQQAIQEFEANPPKEGEPMPMFNPDAWYGVAKEIKERCDAFYSRDRARMESAARSQPEPKAEPEITIVAAVIRDLHEGFPDDYTTPCWDVVFKTSDGRLLVSDDLYYELDSAKEFVEDVGSDYSHVELSVELGLDELEGYEWTQSLFAAKEQAK